MSEESFDYRTLQMLLIGIARIIRKADSLQEAYDAVAEIANVDLTKTGYPVVYPWVENRKTVEEVHPASQDA